MAEQNTPGFRDNVVQYYDEKGFESLYRRLYPGLKKYAIYLIRDEQESQLIINNVFLSLWKNKTIPENEKAYLFRAIKNACTNHHKRPKANLWHIDGEDEQPEFNDQLATPVEILEEKDRKQFLHALINQMPERRKLIFYLYRIDGLSYKEIATLLDISVRTVEDHLIKGFQYLQQQVIKNESSFR